MYKRSPLAYIIAALSCATIIALCVLLPRCLSRNHQSALLGTTQVEPLEAMPVEATPTPLPEEKLVDRAIEWYARQNQSAQFVNLQEDVEPSAEELDRAAPNSHRHGFHTGSVRNVLLPACARGNRGLSGLLQY